ncbi:hypothetical protein BBK36DRAFT_1114251, partial [Trichoderma citrinoviride]
IGDERKPRCQRCIDAEAECVYGQRVSFLQKNAFTLASDPGGDSHPRTPGTPKYSKVKFVADEATKQKDGARRGETSTSTASKFFNEGENANAHRGLPPSGTNTKATPSVSSGRQESLRLDSVVSYQQFGRRVDKSHDAQAQNDASPHGHDDHSHQDVGIIHGDSYEIALDVLMNLGTGDAGVDTLAPVTTTYKNHAEDNVTSLPLILNSIDEFGLISDNVQRHMPSGRTIELLRHYRYKVAPWLDMWDMDQTFGLVVPHLATRSDMLFDALLNLCAVSYANNPHDQGSHHSHPTNGDPVTYPIQHGLEHSKTWEAKLWSILTATKDFLIKPPQSWDAALANNASLHMIYSQMAESGPLRGVDERMLWLLARLGE